MEMGMWMGMRRRRDVWVLGDLWVKVENEWVV